MKGIRVGIVGLGLIGGSLALALKGRRGAPEVWGHDASPPEVRSARRAGAVDRACGAADMAASCDVVVVCVPVLRSVEVIRSLGPRMRPGTVLTDAGSVKSEVVREGQKAVAPGAEFVGGHPIAGTEHSGFAAADAALFRGRTTVITPTGRNSPGAVRRVEALWERAGSRVVRMTPALHDRTFAYVSHLPHVVAYALVHAVATLEAPVPLGYSAGGFRDFTRIASSNPLMWKDIVIQNRAEVLRAVRRFRGNLGILEALVRRRDAEGLVAYFRKAKNARDGLT